MLRDAITGREITSVYDPVEFKLLQARLPQEGLDRIVTELVRQLDEVLVGGTISASWIPGHDWVGTIYMPIYEKVGRQDEKLSALFFGTLMQDTVIHHKSWWSRVKTPKAPQKDPEGMEITLYWRVD